MRTSVAALALAGASLALGGCQSLFGTMFSAKAPARVDPAAEVLADYFGERINAGKGHLLAHRPAQAIIAFRQAAYDPAHAAEAYNGLGIAYAAIGREDLAQRYFELAMLTEPSDERFARNLARLNTELDPALAAQQAPGELPATAALAMPTAAPPAADIAEPVTSEVPAKLTRVSSNEVRVTAPAGSAAEDASSRAVSAPRTAALAANAPSYSPVHAAGLKPRRAPYPVRVTVASMARDSRPTYPVRIELPTTK